MSIYFLALLDYFNPLTPENILEESLSNFELKIKILQKRTSLCALESMGYNTYQIKQEKYF